MAMSFAPAKLTAPPGWEVRRHPLLFWFDAVRGSSVLLRVVASALCLLSWPTDACGRTLTSWRPTCSCAAIHMLTGAPDGIRQGDAEDTARQHLSIW